MKIDKVSYQKTYSIGPYLTERLGFEATLEEGDTPHNALIELRHISDRTHEKLNPHLYQDKGFGDLPEHQKTEITFGNGQPPTINLQWEKAEIAIENAQSIEDLDSIKADYPTLPGRLLTLFNNKKQQLNENS